MAKQTFTTGQVLTAAQMTSLQQTAMGGGSATTKTASYTLVAADAGTTVTMTSASATTITVNTALFAAGDTVYIQNLGAGVSTITAGTATVNTSATLALAQYEGGQLYFTSASASIFVKGAGAGAGGMTLLSTTSMNTGTATVTVSSINQTYKTLQIQILNPTWGTGNSQMLLSAQGSSSIQGAGSFMWNSGANVTATAFSGTSFATTGQQVSNTTARINTIWEIYNYASTTAYKSWGVYVGDDSRGGVGGGVIATNTAISSFAVSTTGSYNFNGGSILVYGIN